MASHSIPAGRPANGSFPDYFGRYISKVAGPDVRAALTEQFTETRRVLSAVPESSAGLRYAPGKWSIREVAGHITDAERIFAYRLLAIARGEEQSLPGFDENKYVLAADFDQRTLAGILDELSSVRAATLTLIDGLSADAWTRVGVMNGNRTSVHALAFIIAGHERHHLGVLAERYGLR